ncbi:MAG TPA: DUF6457 domain-containing protein [Actinomycetota bacterium]
MDRDREEESSGAGKRDGIGWVNGLASELRLDPLSKHEVDHVLTVSREVAHRVERKVTPLAMYVVGLAVGRQLADRGRDEVIEDVIHTLLLRLPGDDGA